MRKRFAGIWICLTLLTAHCAPGSQSDAKAQSRTADEGLSGSSLRRVKMATAVFAGGCFWCMEKAYDDVKGVIATTSGYTGGTTANPTYEEVSSSSTGHVEAVKVAYDSNKISYEKLLDIFWHNIDPTVKDRQFCDVGSQYQSVIFYRNDAQKRLAFQSKAKIERTAHMKVQTQIRKLQKFYPAEDYHQDFYKKNPIRYQSYRNSCGQDATLKRVWRLSAPQ